MKSVICASPTRPHILTKFAPAVALIRIFTSTSYNVYDVEDLTASGEPDEDVDPIGDSDWMWEYILDLNYEGTGICGRVFATDDEIYARMANDPRFDDIWTREGLCNYITANYTDTGLEYDDRVYGAAMATFEENPDDHYFRWFCECVLPVDLEQRWDSANR